MNETGKQLPLSGKKLYQAPILRVYGDIRLMTHSKGNTSTSRDAIGGPPNKTL
jgi:hypothetical protein